MKNKRIIFGLFLALSFTTCISGIADEDHGDFILRNRGVKYSKEKPPQGGPEARAIEAIGKLKERKFSEVKSFFSSSMNKEDLGFWEFVNMKFDTPDYQMDQLLYWGVTKIKDGNPIVLLAYKKKNGSAMTINIPMKKEDGSWMISGKF